MLPLALATLIALSFSCQSSKNAAESQNQTPSETTEAQQSQNNESEQLAGQSNLPEENPIQLKEDELKEKFQLTDEKLPFREVWGYVMNGREHEFSVKYPITDVGYFVDAVNIWSEQGPVPVRDKFFKNYTGRVHLVTSCDSSSQTHLLLDPNLPLRNRIITQLVEASKTYDGLQVDWELVKKRDKQNFLEFLKILKRKLGNKPLTVAIPARTKTLQNDQYDYADLAKIVDKILIMAYDEHWSTSAPGAIGSTDWCKRIAEYAKTVIPENKLIMGISFYGRIWTNDKEGGRAWYHEGMERIRGEKSAQMQRDDFGVPYYQFQKTVTLTGWFDDTLSLKIKCQMYKDINIDRIGFWRVGQEDKNFWKHIKISK